MKIVSTIVVALGAFALGTVVAAITITARYNQGLNSLVANTTSAEMMRDAKTLRWLRDDRESELRESLEKTLPEDMQMVRQIANSDLPEDVRNRAASDLRFVMEMLNMKLQVEGLAT